MRCFIHILCYFNICPIMYIMLRRKGAKKRGWFPLFFCFIETEVY